MHTATMWSHEDHIEYRKRQYKEMMENLKKTDPDRYLQIRKAVILRKLHRTSTYLKPR